MNSVVRTEQCGAALIVSIDRPKQRNAVNRLVALGIAAAMDRLDSELELQVGILTGLGGCFSAGMDLRAFLDGEPREIEGRGFGGLTDAPPRKPLIAAVEGFALGGGFELVLACDLIVAAEDAWFGLPEVKRGLIAGSGGLVRLPRKIPPAIALEHALTGDRLNAHEAYRWGLVNRLTSPGSALEGAKEMAARIIRNGPLAVAVTKQLVVESASWPPDEVWARQAQLLKIVLASEDAHEGALAFIEKREPRWQCR